MSGQDSNRTWFSRRVNENMDALYGVALRLTGSGADAEDLVAESAYHEDGGGDESDVVSLLNEQPDEFLCWWANPEREFFNNVLGETIMSAISGLPETFRITVLLVSVEGLTYDEAAEVLGVPPGTVRSRMKRGRTMLQKALWHLARDAGLINSMQRSGQVQ